MKRQAIRTALFGVYQLSILLGILLMPIALITSRLGVVLPVGDLVDWLGGVYEEVDEAGGRAA